MVDYLEDLVSKLGQNIEDALVPFTTAIDKFTKAVLGETAYSNTIGYVTHDEEEELKKEVAAEKIKQAADIAAAIRGGATKEAATASATAAADTAAALALSQPKSAREMARSTHKKYLKGSEERKHELNKRMARYDVINNKSNNKCEIYKNENDCKLKDAVDGPCVWNADSKGLCKSSLKEIGAGKYEINECNKKGTEKKRVDCFTDLCAKDDSVGEGQTKRATCVNDYKLKWRDQLKLKTQGSMTRGRQDDLAKNPKNKNKIANYSSISNWGDWAPDFAPKKTSQSAEDCDDRDSTTQRLTATCLDKQKRWAQNRSVEKRKIAKDFYNNNETQIELDAVKKCRSEAEAGSSFNCTDKNGATTKCDNFAVYKTEMTDEDTIYDENSPFEYHCLYMTQHPKKAPVVSEICATPPGPGGIKAQPLYCDKITKNWKWCDTVKIKADNCINL
jgi:hypothetical protein